MPQYEVRQTLTVERLFEVEAEDAVVDDTFVTVEAGVAIP
jgi:hypothetical protein